MTYVILFLTILWVAITLFLFRGSLRLKKLKLIQVPPAADAAPLVIVVAVRNEAKALPAAMERLCQLQYPTYRILAVNDRSTDGSGEILESFARRYPHFETLPISQLPEGWLGKNHALYAGVQHSTEPYILFTDADVHFTPDALSKAMWHVQQQQLAHLAVLPRLTSPSLLFRSVMDTFKLMLELQNKPWDAVNPRSRASLGVGAFNLVSRQVYEAIGTHRRFSLRPDDDLQLGKRIKAAGGKAEVMYGDDAVSVDWYASLGEFVNGLMKNTFSVFDYRLPMAVSAALATLIVFVLPLPLCLFAGSTLSVICGAVLLACQLLLFRFKPGMEGRWWFALMMPLAGLVMAYITLVSAFRTLRQNGIYWRDTFYSLDTLKQQSSL